MMGAGVRVVVPLTGAPSEVAVAVAVDCLLADAEAQLFAVDAAAALADAQLVEEVRAALAGCVGPPCPQLVTC